MPTKLYITQALIIAEDLATRTPYFKAKKEDVKHFRSVNDQFSFFPAEILPNSSVENQPIPLIIPKTLDWDTTELEPEQLTYLEFSDIVNDLGVPYASADALDDYLNENLGFFSNPDSITTQADGVILYNDYEATIADGAEIDSGWLDLSKADKFKFVGSTDSVGMTLVIESSNISGGGEADLNTTTEIEISNFHLFSVPPRQDFMRFRWQNNTGVAVNDGFLGITAFYGSSDKASVFPVYTEPSQFSQATLVQAILRGKDIHGDFREVSVNPNGQLQTSRYVIDAARNEISGITKFSIKGNNPDVDTNSAPEDVWERGGDYTGFDAVNGEAIEVVSDSNQDTGLLLSSGTATGGSFTTLEDTGATFVTDGVAVGDCIINDSESFHGIVLTVTSETVLTVRRFRNGNFEGFEVGFEAGDAYRVATSDGDGVGVVKLEQLIKSDYTGFFIEYIITDGTTGVLTVGTDYIRGSQAVAIIAGSDGFAAGDIQGNQAVTTSNIFWDIEEEENKSQVCCGTVPKGYTLYVWVGVQMARANGSPGSATVQFLTRPVGEVFDDQVFATITNSQDYQTISEDVIEIEEESDFKWRVKDVSDNNTVVNAEADGYLIQK